MFKIRRTFEVAGAHKLDLDYESKCKNCHGHNWSIIVELSSPCLDRNSMIMDFGRLKDIFQARIHSKLDHKNLNEELNFNPTAENIAKWVYESINRELVIQYNEQPLIKCSKVVVVESVNNEAEYSEC
jgi:6-pyruvoyltetrahydropterin/6-carboxytetrahydropterin synthase